MQLFLYTITLPAPNFHTCRLASAIIRVQYRPMNSVTQLSDLTPSMLAYGLFSFGGVFGPHLRGAQLNVVLNEHEPKAAN